MKKSKKAMVDDEALGVEIGYIIQDVARKNSEEFRSTIIRELLQLADHISEKCLIMADVFGRKDS